MAQRSAPKKESPAKLRLAVGGVAVALLILLLAILVRTPLHPPYYDTISAVSEGQVDAP